jgi:chromosome segregation ATPase
MQREQKTALEAKIKDLESRMREKDSQHRKLQSEAKSAQRDEQSALEKQLRDLESLLREKESQLRLLQASSKAVQHKAHQDAIDLDEQAEALTKRHIKEINGLAKQIQYLRARCARAEGFREALGYQKRFFLMQIQVYSEW